MARVENPVGSLVVCVGKQERLRSQGSGTSEKAAVGSMATWKDLQSPHFLHIL